jgi:hypothetical protein
MLYIRTVLVPLIHRAWPFSCEGGAVIILVVENRRCERRGLISRCMVVDMPGGGKLGNCLESEGPDEGEVDTCMY